MKQNHLTWRMLSLSIMMGLMCLMGNNAEARRKWIDDNIDFTLEEDYRVTRNG